MAGSSGSFQDEESARMITDINVTPLVDIVLVLLIIFMVTASFIVNPAIKVDLPKAASGSEQTRTTLALTLDKAGGLYLNGEKTDEPTVTRFIAAELPKNPDLQAIIAADRVVSHGQVVAVIDLVKRAGIRKFAIDVQAGLPEAVPALGAAAPAIGAEPAAGAGPATRTGPATGAAPGAVAPAGAR